MNVLDLFEIARRRDPVKIALHSESAGLSYEALLARSGRLAGALSDRGVTRADRVALFLANGVEFVLSYLAVIRLGGIVVPVNLAYRQRELGHILADAEPTLIICDQARLDILAEVEEAAAIDTQVAEQLAELERTATPFAPCPAAGDDPALIMYTSGTTGRSKGAVISHNNLLATVTGLLAAWGWRHDDVLLLTLPLFHVHGLVVGLHCAMAAGATVWLRERFDAERSLAELTGGGPTLFFAVPTIYGRLVEAIRAAEPRPDLSGMRLFCSGSAPLPPSVFEEFETLTGHTILERYGMTETGMNLSNPYTGSRRPGTVGTPLPGVSMRIVGDEGDDIAAGVEGDLLVRGGNVFSGYWRNDEATREAFVHDDLGRRWFRTGDLARQDPETGAVTLLGRRHELIISGGFNIYPKEIEETLLEVDGIREAAVVGRSHPEWGEVPVAFLVTDGDIDSTELEAHCRRRLASFKRPQRMHVVEELPRNALGKVLKHLLPE